MTKHTFLFAVVLVVASLFFVPNSGGQECSFPPKGLTSDKFREYRGLYENKAYGYSVVIPGNLVGYDGANPFYQHGFGITLGKNPQSYVLVNGEPNSLEFAHPVAAAHRFLKYLHKHGAKVKSSKITESQLGHLKAVRLAVTYTCPGSMQRYVRISVIAISPDKGTLYEIALYSHSGRIGYDSTVLDALVKSWKALGR